MLNRRDVLRSGVMVSAGLLLPSTARAFGLRPDSEGPVLVIVQLTGGNDGLNTVVPFLDDLYHRARPVLRLEPSALHRVSDQLGLPPSLKGLATEFREGRLSIAQGVGMARPDRSHFTTLARWHAGRLDVSNTTAGWLGRTLKQAGTPRAVTALALGGRAVPDLLRGAPSPLIACEDLSTLLPSKAARKTLRSAALRDLDALWGEERFRKMARQSGRLLEDIENVLADEGRVRRFPGSSLGRQLADVVRMILHGPPVSAFFVQTGGFDTHSRQDKSHPELLEGVDRALCAFFAEIRAAHHGRRVLVLVHSEFGRRVAENGTRGTDHGSGAPAFLWGGRTPGGLIGQAPNLSELDEGDVRATLDFRRLLAEAEQHLGSATREEVVFRDVVPLFA